MPEFTSQLSDSLAIAPRSITTVLADKKAVEAELLSKSTAFDAQLLSKSKAFDAQLLGKNNTISTLEARLKEAEARLTALRKDVQLKKREWRAQNDALSKELSSMRSVTTKVASKAVAMTNERVSYDSALRQQLQDALKINENHNKAMMDLNSQFMEVMSTVSGSSDSGNSR